MDFQYRIFFPDRVIAAGAIALFFGIARIAVRSGVAAF